MITRAFDDDWDRIVSAGADELSKIEGVGPVIARQYTEWFLDPDNRTMAASVLSEVRLSEEQKRTVPVLSAPGLFGKTFVITGSLNGYKSRDMLAEKIESLGGKVSGSVSKKTDYLINNDAASQSSKNKAARELGVSVITEAEFEELTRRQSGNKEPG